MSKNDHCIHGFDKSRRKKAAIGIQGSGDVQFSFLITGITISGDVMLVTDLSGHRIQKLSITGEFLINFGTQESGKGQLNHPWGMCLSSNSNLSVADYSNSRVAKSF